MRRFELWVGNKIAQVKLFFAEIHHDSALRTVHNARVELERATAMAKHTKGELRARQEDAVLAGKHVRRWRERMAVGLR